MHEEHLNSTSLSYARSWLQGRNHLAQNNMRRWIPMSIVAYHSSITWPDAASMMVASSMHRACIEPDLRSSHEKTMVGADQELRR